MNSLIPADDPTMRRSRVGWYLELGKTRLSALVLATTAGGFLLAEGPSVRWGLGLWTIVGTAMVAMAANALNQCWEIEPDRRMARTRNRPMPTGVFTLWHATAVSVTTGVVGVVILGWAVNLLTAVLGLITLLIYVLVYTPLKGRTPANTLVGAVCGALPPMMGWSAVTGGLSAGAWILGGILFVWQIPHFLALAWLYRQDYARGGFQMLPIIDPDGQLTSRSVLVASFALIPLAMLVTRTGMAGGVYAAGSLALGAVLLIPAVQLAFERTDAGARRVFLASLVYLSLLMVLMVADRIPAG